MSEWYAPIAAFAKTRGYTFTPEYAFCRLVAPLGAARVHLWISRMGSGNARATMSGTFDEWGEIHLRATARMAAKLEIEVRRRNLLDSILRRGKPSGHAEIDARYVALGSAEDVQRFLNADVVHALLDTWERTEGVCVEDGVVTLQGGEFTMSPKDLEFVIGRVGTIANGGV